ncbi:hypothetical protein L284_20010 [Novosphingobium lindaniclasticum LE124]|uniref:Uncharacterized protein n=1 Tax=Novosphingobium lindaniclasticum LE124 TaxID=1096930 RepID=T0H8F5_9SPHN|nr:hypothetical protein L284_20010 [Novosphingobium lindaniclasticum LE124]
MAVYAAQFKRNPVRADVPFFENMERHALLLANTNGRHVVIATVPEQDDISDPLSLKQLSKEAGPVVRRAAILDAIRKAPECPIPAVKINLVNSVSARDQPLAEPTE